MTNITQTLKQTKFANIKRPTPAPASDKTAGDKLAGYLENLSNALCRSLSSEIRVHWHYRGF